jgi:hypothetical protein
MKRTIFTAILLLGSVLAAQAQPNTQTYTFKDVLKPNGQVRHGAAERVDAVACGMTKNFKFYDRAALEKCMLARGWAVDQVTWESQAATDAHNRAILDPGDADARAVPQEGAAAVSAATMHQ